MPVDSPSLPQRLHSLVRTSVLSLPFAVGLCAQDAHQDVPSAFSECVLPIAAPPGAPAELWGGGRNYKVALHDGFVFYPHVGAELTHRPFAWRTTSIRVGHRERLGQGLPAAPVHDATRVDYDLGIAVESYELRVDGVEQTFRFAARPGQGDLVIRGAVTTPLQLPVREWAHAPLALRLDDGRAVVSYGAAVAIDADGDRFPMSTRCDGTAIELRLPAAAVAAADFPLVVDPWIGNDLLDYGAPVEDADILHDALTPTTSTNMRIWVAQSREVAAGDRDVWMMRCNDAYAGVPVTVFEDLTLEDAKQPSLGLAAAAQEVVMAYCWDPHSSVTRSEIRVHEHGVAFVGQSSSYKTVSTLLGHGAWRPDVGGRPDQGALLIVYQLDIGLPLANSPTSQVWGAMLDPTSAAATIPSIQLHYAANTDKERPVVTKMATGGQWLMAWQEHDGNIVNDDWDIAVAAVSETGAVVSAGIALQQANSATWHKVGPVLDGSDGRYVVGYVTRQFDLQDPKPQARSGEALWTQRFDFDHATNTATLPWPAEQIETLPGPALYAGGLAFDATSRSHWCLTSGNANNGVGRVRKLGYHGAETESWTIQLQNGLTTVMGGVTFDGLRRQFEIAFGTHGAPAGLDRLYGARMTYDAVPPPATYGFACGSGVWGGVPELLARQQVGAEHLSLELRNAPHDGFAFLVWSLGHAPGLPLGTYGLIGCDLHVDLNAPNYLALQTVGVVGGQGRVFFDLPEFLGPMRFFLQWCYLAPGANPAGLQVSQGLDLPIGR